MSQADDLIIDTHMYMRQSSSVGYRWRHHKQIVIINNMVADTVKDMCVVLFVSRKLCWKLL